MKESVFDVLIYLFENYFYDDEPRGDRDTLATELFQAGFTQSEVNKAFAWLDGLAASRQESILSVDGLRSFRVYTRRECDKLDTDCQGLLLFLEQLGILTPASREVIIDRAMALEEDEVDVDTLKWVVLMVLFDRPGEEEAYACMENLLFETPAQYVH